MARDFCLFDNGRISRDEGVVVQRQLFSSFLQLDDRPDKTNIKRHNKVVYFHIQFWP